MDAAFPRTAIAGAPFTTSALANFSQRRRKLPSRMTSGGFSAYDPREEMDDSRAFWVDFLQGMIKPAAAVAVVLVAVALSFFQNLGLEREMIYSISRAFLQLSVIGFVSVAGYTAGQRAKHVPRGKYVAGASILTGTAVETALALGATPRQATLHQVKRALIIALSPVLDNTKTVGLISLPGAMTGLIMGGASPLEAIQLQIVVMNMLVGAATISSLMSTYLCWPVFFTKAYQLQPMVLLD
ncbi:Agglutinin-like protein 3 [Asimina triloba]